MKVFQKTIDVKTKGLNDFVLITSQIQKIVDETKISDGMVFANALHNTAALILQEDDPTIHSDLVNILEKEVPMNKKYLHNYESNENATAHLKSNLLGTSVTIPLKNGELVLGTWQDVFLVELFEPRERKIVVTIIGE